jgi:hypothetical protein
VSLFGNRLKIEALGAPPCTAACMWPPVKQPWLEIMNPAPEARYAISADRLMFKKQRAQPNFPKFRASVTRFSRPPRLLGAFRLPPLTSRTTCISTAAGIVSVVRLFKA